MPTNTTTTPAMPKAAAMADPLRRGIVQRPNQVTEAICDSQLIISKGLSLAAQSVSQAQAHRLNRRQNSRDEAKGDREHAADNQVARRDKENREKLPDKTGLPQPHHHQPAERQAQAPAEDGDGQRFAQNDP